MLLSFPWLRDLARTLLNSLWLFLAHGLRASYEKESLCLTVQSPVSAQHLCINCVALSPFWLIYYKMSLPFLCFFNLLSGCVGIQKRFSVERVVFVLGCCNYLCKFELLFQLNHCIQASFSAVPKSCVSGPPFFPLPFSICGTTDRIAYLLCILKTGVCAISSLRQDAEFFIALKQTWFSVSIRYIQHSLKF